MLWKCRLLTIISVMNSNKKTDPPDEHAMLSTFGNCDQTDQVQRVLYWK